MRLSRTNQALAAIAFAIILGCGGAGAGTESSSLYGQSVDRLTQVNTGLRLYTSDWDDNLPLGGSWMDALNPYVKDLISFRSPAVQSEGYGYALNSAVAGRPLSAFPDRASAVSVFDSTNLARNAVAAIDTLPYPPRYGAYNTIGYLDGSVPNNESSATVESLYQTSKTRIKTVAVGSLMYASDNDDFLPLAGQWMDGMAAYVPSERNFRSPLIEKQDPAAYGYAFSSDLAGRSTALFESPSTTTSFFDSTLTARNATASTSTLPSPARYGSSNTIARLDGSVAP